MACDPQTLATDAKCLATALHDHELLAYIAWQLATNAGVDPAPATLIANAKCLLNRSDRELLAAIAWLQCQLNGG